MKATVYTYPIKVKPSIVEMAATHGMAVTAVRRSYRGNSHVLYTITSQSRTYTTMDIAAWLAGYKAAIVETTPLN